MKRDNENNDARTICDICCIASHWRIGTVQYRLIRREAISNAQITCSCFQPYLLGQNDKVFKSYVCILCCINTYCFTDHAVLPISFYSLSLQKDRPSVLGRHHLIFDGGVVRMFFARFFFVLQLVHDIFLELLDLHDIFLC